MLGNMPSEGVYEDIGAVAMGEKDEGPWVAPGLELEDGYDDAAEPEDSPEWGPPAGSP